MENAADVWRFALDQPMATAPGATFVYNSGATNLLGRLIARRTGMPLQEYAAERLFGPLGITDVEWDGAAWAHAGLRLRPGDLARIGQMVLQDGSWDGRRLVPADWLAASFRRRIAAVEGCHNGYSGGFAPPKAASLCGRRRGTVARSC